MAGSRTRAALLLLLVFAAGAAAGIAADRLEIVPGEATARQVGGDGADAELRDDDERDGREVRRDGRRDRRRDGDRRERRTTIEKFADDLELTAEQRSEIEGILEEYRASVKQMWSDVRPRYRALLDSARTRIEAVLTPEQVTQYRALLEERYGDGDDDDEKQERDRGGEQEE